MRRVARILDGSTVAVLVAGAALTALTVAAWVVLIPDPPGRSGVPPARSLAALDGYLAPVPDTDVLRGSGVPATVVVRGDPFRTVAAVDAAGGRAGPIGTGGPPADRAPRWRLNAIMVAGDRQLAIVNDVLVRPGERMADGTELLAVGTDHVIILTPDGQRRRLEMER